MRSDREFVFGAVADERRQSASLLDGLDDAQLATPSCDLTFVQLYRAERAGWRAAID